MGAQLDPEQQAAAAMAVFRSLVREQQLLEAVAPLDELLSGHELEPVGHIDRVYVSADRQRRGIGRQLLAAVVAEARRVGLARLFTEASITARPFFEAQGFAVLTPQVVTCRGAEFVNYRMEGVLAEPAAADR